MKKRSILRGSALAGALAALALFLPQEAAAQTPDDRWHFVVGIDGWLPTIHGGLKYAPPATGGNPEVSIGPSELFSSLNAVVPIFAEARKGKVSLFADVIYLSLGTDKSSVIGVGPTVPVDVALNAHTSTTLKSLMGTLVGGYAVVESPGGRVDVIVGVRTLSIRATTEWELSADITGPGGGVILTKSGSISQKVVLWDGVVGARGRVNLTEKWFLPFYADIGTGSSALTYQFDAGLAYAWSWGNTGLTYRYLYYDQKDDKLLQNMKFQGPELTIAFRF